MLMQQHIPANPGYNRALLFGLNQPRYPMLYAPFRSLFISLFSLEGDGP